MKIRIGKLTCVLTKFEIQKNDFCGHKTSHESGDAEIFVT